jgi:hypothetical protein
MTYNWLSLALTSWELVVHGHLFDPVLRPWLVTVSREAGIFAYQLEYTVQNSRSITSLHPGEMSVAPPLVD